MGVTAGGRGAEELLSRGKAGTELVLRPSRGVFEGQGLIPLFRAC
jgi:hypothetical protein